MANKFSGNLGVKKPAAEGFGALIRGKKDVVEARWINTDEIYSRAQVRRTFDEEEIAGLARTLKGKKQRQAIILYPADANGHHCIYMGERRWRAAKVNNEPVLAIIDESLKLEDIQDVTTTLDQLIENVQREDLTALDLGLSLANLRKQGMSTKDIAAGLGKKSPWVSKHLKLALMPPMIRELFESKVVTYIETLNVLTEAAATDEERTRKFIEEMIAAENGIGRAQAQAFCDELTGKNKAEPQPAPSQAPDLNTEPSQAPDLNPEPSQAPDLNPEPSQVPDLNPEPDFEERTRKVIEEMIDQGEQQAAPNLTPAPDLNEEPNQAPDLNPEQNLTSTHVAGNESESFNVFDNVGVTVPKVLISIEDEEWELLLEPSIFRDGDQFVKCQRDGLTAEFPAKDCIVSKISLGSTGF